MTTGGDDPDGAGSLTGWTVQDSGGTESSYAVAFADAQQGWAVRYYRVLRTNNGGADWVTVDLGEPMINGSPQILTRDTKTGRRPLTARARRDTT
jgi:hypothetical protein